MPALEPFIKGLQIWLDATDWRVNKGLYQNALLDYYGTWDENNYINGKLGKECVLLNGTDNYIYGQYQSSANITFAAWIYLPVLPGGKHVFDARDSSGNGYQPMYLTNSSIQVGCSASGFPSFNYNWATNTWYHVCVTHNTTEVKCYINGTLIGTSTTGKGVENCGGGKFYIGSRYNQANYSNVAVDDVRIYGRCLTEQEVKKLAQGLVCHLPLTKGGFGFQNLLDNTNFTADSLSNMRVNNGTNLREWTNESANVTLSMDGQYVKLHYNTNTSRYGIHYEVQLSPGTYTYSITAGGRLTCSFGLASTWPTTNVITANTPGRYSATFTVSEFAVYRMYIYTTSANPDIWFNWPKLEISDTATPWENDDAYPYFNYHWAYDISGYNHNGVLDGWLSAVSTPRYALSFGVENTNNKIYIENLPTTGFSNSYSFSWWGKVSTFSGKMFWGFADGVRLNGIYNGNLWNTGDGSQNPLYNIGTTTQVTAPSTNVWHHYVMTGNGTKCYVYLDGELWAEAKTYKSITGTTIWLNGWDDTTSYAYDSNMYMSDFRIYATALSASDVQELYNSHHPVSTSTFIESNSILA